MSLIIVSPHDHLPHAVRSMAYSGHLCFSGHGLEVC